MSITIEPTPEVFEVPVNGVKVPTRVWVGTTDKGTRIDVYVFSIVPTDSNDLAAELPGFMRQTREVCTINLGEEA